MSIDQTNFGFKKVTPAEKISLVGQVFHRVARRYDLMNDVMSIGIHRLWKRTLIQTMRPQGEFAHLLDVAGGTGDIAYQFLKAYPGTQVTLCDINSSMMEVGRDRAFNQGSVKGINWVGGDASCLPFAENTFDIYAIAFGLRNVTFRLQALEEALRILKPGGRFYCLEFSKVELNPLRRFYEAYSFHVIPHLGRLIAQDGDSYQYLVESIAQFPTQKALLKEIQSTGFHSVTFENLTGGIVAIHSGIKPC